MPLDGGLINYERDILWLASGRIGAGFYLKHGPGYIRKLCANFMAEYLRPCPLLCLPLLQSATSFALSVCALAQVPWWAGPPVARSAELNPRVLWSMGTVAFDGLAGAGRWQHNAAWAAVATVTNLP
jgi:hypothetical protein